MISNPITWNKLIELLSPYFDTPIVAGGAIRDYQLGVPPKDIDIFVFDINQDGAEIEAALPWLKPLHKEDSNEYSTMDDVEMVWEGEWEKLRINVVWMSHTEKTGIALADTFDFGLCRIWWQPGVGVSGGTIIRTKAFDRDLVHKTVTMLIDGKKERSIRRFKRFNARHGDLFILVYPDGTPVSLFLPEDKVDEIPF